MTDRSHRAASDRLATRALGKMRGAFVSAFATTAVINVLALCASLFTMQVYDRVLPAHSLPTLVSLCAIMLAVYAVQAVLEGLRSRILSRIGAAVDAAIMPAALARLRQQALSHGAKGDGMQVVRDVDQLRTFLSGAGPLTLFDLPWMPLFLLATFVIHPWIGVATMAGALLLTGLLVLTEKVTTSLNARSVEQLAARNAYSDAIRRDAETVSSMGLADRMQERFLAAHRRLGETGLRLADVTATYAPVSRACRQLLQLAIVALGAYLVIEGQASPGIMFAASMLTGRALMPIDAAIASWRQMQAARQSLDRLDGVLTETQPEPMPIPLPSSGLKVSNAAIGAPGARTPTLSGVDFQLAAGEALVVLGASGSGKSTLGRALTGIWPTIAGEIRLDGAGLQHWSEAARGRFTGYLPQCVELLDGTIAENISRFAREAKPEDVVAAASAAGVHELILSLPNGYDTLVGANGVQLSGGQRQRVGLARALFGKPFLVVLDEPNSALDAKGEAVLNAAIAAAKQSGSIVVVIAHRASVLAHADKALVLDAGRQVGFGPAREVLARMSGRTVAARRAGSVHSVGLEEAAA